MKVLSGIYRIRNIRNEKNYVGYAINFNVRWRKHRNSLKRGCHTNVYLQRAWNKYGENSFEWIIVQELPCEEKLLKNMEIYWIAFFRSFRGDGMGYNLTRGGEGNWGWEPSEECKQKNSDSHKLIADPNGNFSTINQQGRILENSSSKYSGVRFRPEMSAWNWQIKYKRKEYSDNKNYITEECAAFEYNKKALELYGDSAKLNIIPEEDLKIAQIKEKEYRDKLDFKTSKYKYVSWNQDKQKYAAVVKNGKEIYYGGRHNSETEAAMVVNEILLELYGWKAQLNDIPQSEIDSLWNLD